MVKCVVSSCLNREQLGADRGCSRAPKRFFSFPKDPARVKVWLAALREPDKQASAENHVICEDHFLPEDVSDSGVSPDAIPIMPPCLEEELGLDAWPEDPEEDDGWAMGDEDQEEEEDIEDEAPEEEVDEDEVNEDEAEEEDDEQVNEEEEEEVDDEAVDENKVEEQDDTQMVTEGNTEATDEATAPPADEAIAPPADEAIAPPADEAIAPPADEATAPPADRDTAPPAVEAIAPPADEDTPPPADRETAPLADGDTPPTADGQTAPPAAPPAEPAVVTLKSSPVQPPQLSSPSKWESKKSLREDVPLTKLSRRFLELLLNADGSVDVREAARTLQSPKRRLYEVTNILMGIDLLRKESVNRVRWTGKCPISSFLWGKQKMQQESEKLKRVEDALDGLIKSCAQQLFSMTDDRDNANAAFVTFADVRSLPAFQDQTVIVVKAPEETKLEVPTPKEDSIQVHLKSGSGPISVLTCDSWLDVSGKILQTFRQIQHSHIQTRPLQTESSSSQSTALSV